jgi:hypothetical protein
VFVVSWFADGPKWENMLTAPFYSQGLTYFRPFRYRDEWISVDLLAQLEQSVVHVKNSSKEEGTLLGAKFLDSDLLIPIREIELTQVSKRGDEHYLYLRLGCFIDYRNASSLLEFMPQVMETVNGEDHQKRFHKSALDLGSLSFVQKYDLAAENQSWTRFVDLLCSCTDLPLDQVRQSIFLRLASVRQQNHTEDLKPALIGRTNLEGDIYSYELKEGKSYELEIVHRVPALIGTNFRLTPFEYRVSFAEEFVEVAPRFEEVSGNYQPHVFLLHTRRGTATQDLDLEAPLAKTATYDGQTLHVENFHLRYKSKSSWLKWSGTWGVPSILLFGGILVGLLADAALEEGWKHALLSTPTIWKALGSFAVILGVNWMRWKS